MGTMGCFCVRYAGKDPQAKGLVVVQPVRLLPLRVSGPIIMVQSGSLLRAMANANKQNPRSVNPNGGFIHVFFDNVS